MYIYIYLYIYEQYISRASNRTKFLPQVMPGSPAQRAGMRPLGHDLKNSLRLFGRFSMEFPGSLKHGGIGSIYSPNWQSISGNPKWHFSCQLGDYIIYHRSHQKKGIRNSYWIYLIHAWYISIWQFLPIWIVDFYGVHVGKYTVRPMDPQGDFIEVDSPRFRASRA